MRSEHWYEIYKEAKPQPHEIECDECRSIMLEETKHMWEVRVVHRQYDRYKDRVWEVGLDTDGKYNTSYPAESHKAQFFGDNARERAAEYADWLNSQLEEKI